MFTLHLAGSAFVASTWQMAGQVFTFSDWANFCFLTTCLNGGGGSVSSLCWLFQPYLGTLLFSFFPERVFLFTYLPQSPLIFEHIQLKNVFPTQRFSASHTWYVLKPPGSVSQGSPLSLGGTSHQVPPTQTLLPRFRVGQSTRENPEIPLSTFLQRCPACLRCWRPGFQI